MCQSLGKEALPLTDPFAITAAKDYVSRMDELVKQLSTTMLGARESVAKELAAQVCVLLCVHSVLSVCPPCLRTT